MIKVGGETFHPRDRAMDPDIALSYIEDKIQSVLGDHQRDFEGGVSAENLGARFGGYGSFLPVLQCGPSIQSPSKSPRRKKTCHAVRSPHLASAEDDLVSDPPSALGDGSSTSFSNCTLRTSNSSYPNASNREFITPDKIAVDFPKGAGCYKPKKIPGLNNLKLRIKMSNITIGKYDVEISNLGLTSPSSSEGQSHDESDGFPCESTEIQDDSPASILQMMTSSLVPGGLLLSPLSEDLQNLFGESGNSTKDGVVSEHKGAVISESVRHIKNDPLVTKRREVATGLKSQILENEPSRSGNSVSRVQHFDELKNNHRSDFSTEPKGRVSKTSLKVAASANLGKDSFWHHKSVQRSDEYEQLKSGERRARLALTEGGSLRKGSYAVSNPGDQSSLVARLDHLESSTHYEEGPSRKKRKKATAAADNLKSENAQKLVKSYGDQPLSGTCVIEPPAAATTTGQFFNTSEKTEVASEMIQENWVCCDVCQKWRLLPYYMKSVPSDQWECVMLDWLPGMNHCNIDDEVTTAAARALHPVAVPEDHQNLQGPISGSIAGVTHHVHMSSSPNSSIDEVRKLKLKEKQKGSNLKNPGLRKKMQLPSTKDKSSTSVNFSSARANTTNKSRSHQLLATKKKQKGSAIGDNANPVKYQVFNSEEDYKRSHGYDRRITAEARVQPLKNKIFPTDADVKKENLRPNLGANKRITIKVMDKLRKELGTEQASTAAMSSSSKISDSRKIRLNCVEAKKSPQESVSSSPMRTSCMNQGVPLTMEVAGKVDSRFNNSKSRLVVSRKRASIPTDDNCVGILKKGRDAGSPSIEDIEKPTNAMHGFSNKSRLKMATTAEQWVLQKLDDDINENDVRPSEHDISVDHSSDQMKPYRKMFNLDLRQGDKEAACHIRRHTPGSLGSLKSCCTDSGPLDITGGDRCKALKVLPDQSLQNEASNFNGMYSDRPGALEASLEKGSGVNTSVSPKEHEEVLKEAEDLRHHAENIKNSGFSSESNYEYFQAGLKFLFGTSLLEACIGDCGTHRGMNLMQLYGVTAELFKTCACKFEESQEMAVATLAYKCLEVAYLRRVYCSSSNASKICHDLKSHLQSAPQVGESPSSSASDLDNLNNLATRDNTPLSKSTGSHAHSRSNYAHLLDFIRDSGSAMEAAKMAQEAFSAARTELKNEAAIDSVKRVLDLSFHNVKELEHSVRVAFNNINKQSFRAKY